MARSIKQKILSVVDDYMKGNYRADEVLLRSVFHERAVINGYLGSELISADPACYIRHTCSASSVKPNKPDCQLTVDQVLIRGNTASVIVTQAGYCSEQKLVDYFHLICADGIWLIVSRLFTTC